jgi:hypothetical protein
VHSFVDKPATYPRTTRNPPTYPQQKRDPKVAFVFEEAMDKTAVKLHPEAKMVIPVFNNEAQQRTERPNHPPQWRDGPAG